MRNIWSETFLARFYEVGPDGCITIQALCNYFQEAAGNHAAELGVGMQQLFEKGQSWVLSRFFIQMNQFPQWKQPVAIDTWPAGTERMFALRHFRLRSEGIEIGFGSSAWLLIDLARRRPLRPDFVRDFDMQGPVLGLAEKLSGKVEPPCASSLERSFTVRTSDLDMNQHVNNVNYIDWALEAVPPETRRQGCLQTLQIEFLAECHEGEQVVSKCAVEGDGSCYRHGIYRHDGGLAAAALSCWKTG
jgi:medium-chain acyl-[acyl-carrier-protein] hydrolase